MQAGVLWRDNIVGSEEDAGMLLPYAKLLEMRPTQSTPNFLEREREDVR
jgi:hypothetical protein